MNAPTPLTGLVSQETGDGPGSAVIDQAIAMLKSRAGLVLAAHKRDAVARVLTERTHQTRRGSPARYLAALEHDAADPEWAPFVDAFTINHTAFFREHYHFDILRDFIQGRTHPVSVWSCAASTGEEPYSIAMTLRQACPRAALDQAVWATDIDTQAIDRARAGVYTQERIKPVGMDLLREFFQRGRGAQAGRVRVKPSLSAMVQFDTFNLCAPAWNLSRQFDAIFCRNVMIYFDRATQARVLERFASRLKPGGRLFVGHSENFSHLTRHFHLLGQTVYALGAK